MGTPAPSPLLWTGGRLGGGGQARGEDLLDLQLRVDPGPEGTALPGGLQGPPRPAAGVQLRPAEPQPLRGVHHPGQGAPEGPCGYRVTI